VNTNTNNRETKLLPNARVNNYSAFILLQKTLFEKLKLQTGLRYDNKTLSTTAISVPDSTNYRPKLNNNYGSFSGSFGTTYNFSDELLFRANIAAGYRTPNLAELTSNGQHETRYEVGDNNLVPEKSYEFDASTHYHQDNFTIDVAGFYNIIHHYIFISPTGNIATDGIPIYKYMQQNSSLYGGEAGVHYHPKSVEWLHLQMAYSSVIGKQSNGKYLPFVPANKLNFEIRVEKEKLSFINNAFVAANTHSAFNQNNAAPDETITNGYTLLDLSVGGRIKLMNQLVFISIGVNNIFDSKYIDHLSTLKEVHLYNPGRNFTLSLKVPFG
jgi:iron complex outermembrane receptor protein